MKRDRILVGAVIVIAALATLSAAQDPLVVAPQSYKLQFENDWVRVVRVHYAPFVKLPAHDHPKRQAIFIYLNDGGPVRFKHVEGVSGDYAAVRPPTKAGAYRLAGIQPENHEVENLSDLPNDFLQVELKTEAVNLKSFRGRFFPEFGIKQVKGNYRKLEFENEQARITRLICAARKECDAPGPSPHPALMVALTQLDFMTDAKGGGIRLNPGQTKWLEAGFAGKWRNLSQSPGEHLLIELKTRPVESSGSDGKHKH